MRFIVMLMILATASQGGAEPVMVSGIAPATQATLSTRVQIKAQDEARLASQMEGRITALPKSLGEKFSKGDVLVSFACEHQKAALAAAQAVKIKTEKNLESRQALIKLQAISDLELELAKAEVAQASAEHQRLGAVVSDCRIQAPYNGRVVKVYVNQWETVSRGALLIDIVKTGPLEVEALVPSKWLSWLKVDSVFSVRVDELQSSVDAKVTAIGARIDSVSQTVPIRAKILTPPDGLLPGMSGEAIFRQP